MHPEASASLEPEPRHIVDRLRLEFDGSIARLEEVRIDVEALAELNSRVPTQPAVPRKVLTVEEAARALDVCHATVERLVSSGEIESCLNGASRRIPVDARDAFVGNGGGPA